LYSIDTPSGYELCYPNGVVLRQGQNDMFLPLFNNGFEYRHHVSDCFLCQSFSAFAYHKLLNITLRYYFHSTELWQQMGLQRKQISA